MTEKTESAQIPTWITERERGKAAREHEANLASLQQTKAWKLVQQEAPTFWQNLLDRLKTNKDELPRLGHGFHGTVSPMADTRLGTELECHIEVYGPATRLGSARSYMVLFFQPGSTRIRRWSQDRLLADLELQLGAKGVVATISGSCPMTSQELADDIVQGMVGSVGR